MCLSNITFSLGSELMSIKYGLLEAWDVGHRHKLFCLWIRYTTLWVGRLLRPWMMTLIQKPYPKGKPSLLEPKMMMSQLLKRVDAVPHSLFERDIQKSLLVMQCNRMFLWTHCFILFSSFLVGDVYDWLASAALCRELLVIIQVFYSNPCLVLFFL